MKILAINPGATSTKIGLYEETTLVFKDEINYSLEELAPFAKIADQFDMRRKGIRNTLAKNGIKLISINGVVGRGGLLPPVKAGAYEVNADILECLRERPLVEHAANMGAALALDIAQDSDPACRAFIYDPITVDQFPDIARVSGLKNMDRSSVGHILNMRAVAIQVSQEISKPYADSNFIVAHIGGGTSVSAHSRGRIIDLISDDEGPFSTERTGSLPVKEVIKWCYKNTKDEMTALYRYKGGLISYLGTNNVVEIQSRIANGDKYAELILQAMAYQLGKSIAACAAVLKGNVDHIILTGGVARSEILTNWITEYVRFIAPVVMVPGENELHALAMGGLRVLRGEEGANIFVSGADNTR
jgi:butyrate kinase